MVVPCWSVYNYILGLPFAATLDVMASPDQLKMKYHNIHDEPVTINTDLIWAKRIYQALQHKKKEGEVTFMEINMSLMIK